MGSINNIPEKKLLGLYSTMLEIRKVEEKVSQRYIENEMHTPIHLCTGQEAIAAGVCANLNSQDYVFTNHRGHGHYLAKKGNLKAMIAEFYNRETGCSRGRGGSMHLVDFAAGLPGSSAIVAGGIPLATGTAMAFKMQKAKYVSVSFFGDGASEEGALYESINFAVLKKLPVIYICENNLYSVCTPLTDRQPAVEIYKKVKGFGIPSFKVDGNNVLDVYKRFKQVVKQVRNGGGPAFIECATYRLRDHVGIKTGVEAHYQPLEEWSQWSGKCPILTFEALLKEQCILTEEKKAEIYRTIDENIEEAFAFAKASPLPDKVDLLKYVYM